MACCNAGMSFLRRGLRCMLWLLPLLVACAAVAHRTRSTTPARTPHERPEPSDRLYTADEALRDALVGPWEYVGTGKWPGIDRMSACVFKNPRVFVVNVYCGLKDRPAVRIDVYSPTRGRTSIYAEAKRPISALARDAYFTFVVESSRPPPQRAGGPVRLAMSFDALRDYERQRYGAFLPVCYAGVERTEPKSGCLDSLAPRKQEWEHDNRTFLASASPSWFRIVREMREAGERYGREP